MNLAVDVRHSEVEALDPQVDVDDHEGQNHNDCDQVLSDQSALVHSLEVGPPSFNLTVLMVPQDRGVDNE